MRSDPSTVHRGTSDCTGARAGDEYIYAFQDGLLGSTKEECFN